MNIPSIFWFIPAAAVIALLLAWVFYRAMKREDEGTPRMREIAGHVRRGAMAYLRQQYKVVAIVFVVLALFFAYLAYGAGVQNPWVPFAFLTGGFFSGLAGYFGMKTATYASARTANAARQSLDRGLKVAFRSGAVMGLVVVGLGLLDISFWYVILELFRRCHRTAETRRHHDHHVDLRHGRFDAGALRPRRRRHLHQGGRRGRRPRGQGRGGHS